MNLSNITFQVASADDLPFPENFFDVVVGQTITALASHQQNVIQEFKRALKPGGKVATLDLFIKNTSKTELAIKINEIMTGLIGTKVEIRTHQEWKNLYQDSGFQDTKMVDFYDNIFERSFTFGQSAKIYVN